jgi:hypothetical protein
MKAKIKGLFSLSVSDIEYFNDKQEKFELVNCSIEATHCKELLPEINKNYRESEQYRRNKDYQRSIDSLKSAHNKTLALTEPSCAKCAEFFRTSIAQSLENIRNEQEEMSAGIFGVKRFFSSYLKPRHALTELKV